MIEPRCLRSSGSAARLRKKGIERLMAIVLCQASSVVDSAAAIS